MLLECGDAGFAEVFVKVLVEEVLVEDVLVEEGDGSATTLLGGALGVRLWVRSC